MCRANGGVKSIVALAELQFRVLPGGANCLDDQLFRQIHHRAVIAVRLVQLQHREFGIVPRADAFVAVDSTKLVNPFDSADHQPLEVQFQCNPQDTARMSSVL